MIFCTESSSFETQMLSIQINDECLRVADAENINNRFKMYLIDRVLTVLVDTGRELTIRPFISENAD